MCITRLNLAICLFIALSLAQAERLSACLQEKQPGRCDGWQEGSPEMRYYYNTSHRLCLAFEYSGCGGNGNNFPTRSKCMSQCAPQDNTVCNGGLQPYAAPGEFPLSEEECDQLECPDGYKCTSGSFYSYCCNQTVEEYFGEGFSEDSCTRRHGKLRAHTLYIEDRRYRESITAETCGDLGGLCGAGYKCVQANPLFAKCCEDRATEAPEDIKCARTCGYGTVERIDENGCKDCVPIDEWKPARRAECPEIGTCPLHCRFIWSGFCRECSCKPGDGEFEVVYTFRFPVNIGEQLQTLCVDLSLDYARQAPVVKLLDSDVNELFASFHRKTRNGRYYTEIQQSSRPKYKWINMTMNIILVEKTLPRPWCPCGRSEIAGQEPARISEIPSVAERPPGALNDMFRVVQNWRRYKRRLRGLQQVQRWDAVKDEEYSCYKISLDQLYRKIPGLSSV